MDKHLGQFAGQRQIALPHLIPEIHFTATMLPNKNYVDNDIISEIVPLLQWRLV